MRPSAPEPSSTFALRITVAQFTMATAQTIDYFQRVPANQPRRVAHLRRSSVTYRESIHDALETSIGPLNKGLGAFKGALDAGHVRQLEWNLLREHLSLPTAVLYQDRLLHNLKWMQD